MTDAPPHVASGSSWRSRILILLAVAAVAAAGVVFVRWEVDRLKKNKRHPHAQVSLAEAEQRLKAAMDEATRTDGPWQIQDLENKLLHIQSDARFEATLKLVAAKVPDRWPAFGYATPLFRPVSTW